MATLRALRAPRFLHHSFTRHASTAAPTSAPASPTAPRLRRNLAWTLTALGTGLFAVYYSDSRAAVHTYVLAPALRLLDPEDAHRLALRTLGSGLGPRDMAPAEADDRLRTELWGITLDSPVGLAAGFDKDAEAVDALFGLGFSWVEIGSVTPKPQPGNPRPRVFRLSEDEAIINRYGFPSAGHASVLSRLRARSHPTPSTSTSTSTTSASTTPTRLLAVNLGKNKTSAADDTSDYVQGVRAFAPHAPVLVINISSPNTPGLRDLQAADALRNLLSDVVRARDETKEKPRLVLKIAPDLDEGQVRDVADAVRSAKGVDGVIVSNTTVQRPAGLASDARTETGGLSGPPLRPLTLQTLRTLRAHLPASIPLIACGGVRSGADALAYARAGAAAVQIYTSFIYDGAGAPRRIRDEVRAELEKEGKTWGEVVRGAVEELAWKGGEEKVDKVKGGGKADVKALIKEAEELKGLLDALAEKWKGEAADGDVGKLSAAEVVPPAAAAVGAV